MTAEEAKDAETRKAEEASRRAKEAEKIKEDGRNVRKHKIEELEKEVTTWKDVGENIKQAAEQWRRLLEAKTNEKKG